MACDGPFAVGTVAAEAAPAIARDTPAAPNAGRVVFRCLRFDGRFVSDMGRASCTNARRCNDAGSILASRCPRQMKCATGNCLNSVEGHSATMALASGVAFAEHALDRMPRG